MYKFKARFLATFLTLMVLASSVFGVDTTWVGNAQDVAQVDTITMADTWTSGDTCTVTCNNKDIVITMGTTIDTIAEVAAAVAEAINLLNHDAGNIVADMTINAGGREYGEFYDFTATVSGAVVTLTSDVPGTPFTVTVTESTAGDGTAPEATATAATGKNHFNNADNWDDGNVPDPADSIIFSDAQADVLYNLDNTITQLDIIRKNKYKGNIGLPTTNTTTNNFHYTEYRQTKLSLPTVVTSGQQEGIIGEANSNIIPSGITRIDYGVIVGSSNVLTINDSAALGANGQAAVVVNGGVDLEVKIDKGSFSTGEDGGTTTILSTLKVGFNGDPTVSIGSGMTFTGGTTATQRGGILSISGAPVSAVTFNIHAGTTNLTRGLITVGVSPAVTVYPGGTMNFDHIGITALTIYGTFDPSSSTGSTFTTTTLFKGFTLIDPTGLNTWTNGLDFSGCTPNDGTFNVKANQTWTPSGI